MAKFFGSMVKTGRVGGSVFAVTKGVTIEKQYQPVVYNPSSAAQVAQRAKMKLVSQLSAVLGSELAPFGRDGLVSPRNRFVSDMFSRDAVTYSNGVAQINPSAIRLTNSQLVMVRAISVTRPAANTLSVTGSIEPEYRGVAIGVRVVVLQPRGETGTRYNLDVSGAATLTIDTDGRFSGQLTELLDAPAATVMVYAWAPVSEAAITKYENMKSTSGIDPISLDVLRRETVSGNEYSRTINVLSTFSA